MTTGRLNRQPSSRPDRRALFAVAAMDLVSTIDLKVGRWEEHSIPVEANVSMSDLGMNEVLTVSTVHKKYGM
jgi:hypothetical protein